MDIGGFFASTVTSGALITAIPLAMAAGLVPFLPPLNWVSTALAFVRRHIRIVTIAGATMLSFWASFGSGCRGSISSRTSPVPSSLPSKPVPPWTAMASSSGDFV